MKFEIGLSSYNTNSKVVPLPSLLVTVMEPP